MMAIFDHYATRYDQWFMNNQKVFFSELNLVYTMLKDITLQSRVLSIGCGSGLFEKNLHDRFHLPIFAGVEPSEDMASIAQQRGLRVSHGTAETVNLPANQYDVIYFNGSSSYIKDLKLAYGNVLKGLKPGGRLILFDVPKESAYGLMYLLAAKLGTYDSPLLAGTLPKDPYPLHLASSGYWHTTTEKARLLRDDLHLHDLKFMQTLLHNPHYTNDQVEPAVPGATSGGYVAISAVK